MGGREKTYIELFGILFTIKRESEKDGRSNTRGNGFANNRRSIEAINRSISFVKALSVLIRTRGDPLSESREVEVVKITRLRNFILKDETLNLIYSIERLGPLSTSIKR